MNQEKEIEIKFTKKELIEISEFLRRTDLKGKEVGAFANLSNKFQLAYDKLENPKVEKTDKVKK